MVFGLGLLLRLPKRYYIGGSRIGFRGLGFKVYLAFKV